MVEKVDLLDMAELGTLVELMNWLNWKIVSIERIVSIRRLGRIDKFSGNGSYYQHRIGSLVELIVLAENEKLLKYQKNTKIWKCLTTFKMSESKQQIHKH